MSESYLVKCLNGKYIDDTLLTLRGGEAVVKAWVYEKGEWTRRELTKKEVATLHKAGMLNSPH